MEEDLEDIIKLNYILRQENYQSEEENDENSNSEDETDEYSSEPPSIAPSLEPIDDTVSSEIIESNEQDDEIIETRDLASLQSHLTAEEYDIIISCEDPLLKRLLILNRLKKAQLMALHKKQQSILNECNKQIKVHFADNAFRKKQDTSLRNTKNVYSKLCFPYFKDSKLYRAPPTLDMQHKADNNEINTNYISKYRLWNVKTQIHLKSEVLLSYNSQMFSKSLKELSELKTRKDKDYSEEIDNKTKEVDEYKKNKSVPALWDDECVDWSNIAHKIFGDISSAVACRSFWKIYIHPEINKSPFSNHENNIIKILVEKYHYQNWEDIAVDLGTARSAFMVCVHFHSKLKAVYYQRFTAEEDERLIQCVEAHQVADNIQWSKVAFNFKDRTKHQLYTRFYNKLQLPDSVCGKFSDTEDVMILCLVKKYGENFGKIATEMPTRNSAQISSRYFNYLKNLTVDNKLQLGNWTLEEDQIILDHVATVGVGKWWPVAEKLNRNCTHIRHRYNILKREMKLDPDSFDIQKIPRRVHNMLSVQRHNGFTKEMADYYIAQDMLPEINFHKSAIVTGRPRRAYIDQQLTNFFKSTAQIRKARIKKNVTENELKVIAGYIKQILDNLGVRLHIPNLDTIYEPKLDQNDLSLLKILQNIRPQPDNNQTIILDHSVANEVMVVASPPEELHVKGLIPPNLNTLQIVRGLLLKYQEHNDKKNEMESNTDTILDLEEDDSVCEHLNNFRKRFKSLLKWPSILSISEPNKSLSCDTDTESEEEEVCVVPRNVKKAIGRPKKQGISNKVLAMNEAKAKNKIAKELTAKHSDSNPTNQQTKQIVNNVPLTCVEDVKNALADINKNKTTNSPGKYLIKIDKSMIKKLQTSQQKIFVKKDPPQPSTSLQEENKCITKKAQNMFKKLYDSPKQVHRRIPPRRGTGDIKFTNVANPRKRKCTADNTLENKKVKLVDINEIMSGNKPGSCAETDDLFSTEETDVDDISAIQKDILLLDSILKQEASRSSNATTTENTENYSINTDETDDTTEMQKDILLLDIILKEEASKSSSATTTENAEDYSFNIGETDEDITAIQNDILRLDNILKEAGSSATTTEDYLLNTEDTDDDINDM